MKKHLFPAIFCIFASNVSADTITLDSVQGNIASAIAYVHGVVDSGDAQLIYKWDFLPNFNNPNYVSGTIVSGTFTVSDPIPYLPPSYTLYFKAATVQGSDTTWVSTYKQAFISDTPVAPIFSIITTTPSLNGATETYFYNSGNTIVTMTPYISYVGQNEGFSPHASFELNGIGNGSYLWSNFPTGFTFWRYLVGTSSAGTVTTDTIAITTLSSAAPAWVGILSVASPADSLKVGVLVMGNTLTTLVTLHYSGNGTSDSMWTTVSGANLQDTVWLAVGNLGMETSVTFDVCGYNDAGSMCTNSMSAITNTKLVLVMNSFEATGPSTGIAHCKIHVPNDETAYEGFILSTDADHWDIIDQADSLRPHYNTELYTIDLLGMNDGTHYYLYLYGNATDGEIIDATFTFNFEALASGIGIVNFEKAMFLCDGYGASVIVPFPDKIFIYSSTGQMVQAIELNPGREKIEFTLPNGIYFYQFGSGTGGKFALLH